MNSHEILTEAMEHIKKHIVEFCTDWSIKGIIRNENQIRFSNSGIDINKNWEEIKLNLFLSKDRRTTEISINDLHPGTIKDTLKYCENLLIAAKRNINYKKLPEGPFEYDISIQDKIYDEKVASLGESAIDLVQNGINASLNQGAQRAAGSFFYGDTQYFIENSKNIEAN